MVDMRPCCRLSGHVTLLSLWSFYLLRIALQVEPGQAGLPQPLGRRQLSQWHRLAASRPLKAGGSVCEDIAA